MVAVLLCGGSSKFLLTVTEWVIWRVPPFKDTGMGMNQS